MSAPALPATMLGVGADRYGPADAIAPRRIPVPTPGRGELLVRVRAASVNPADVFAAQGSPWLVRLSTGLVRLRHPIRGTDLAGIVAAVGPDAEGWEVGDAVFGGGTGAFAEYALLRADVAARVPSAVAFEHAAAAAMAGTTALVALDTAGVRVDTKVLVIGASGGIGSMAVQLAKARGAHVTAVCSGRNAPWVRALGADDVVDYQTENILTRGTFDVVLDNVGAIRIRDLQTITRPGGVVLPNSGYRGPDGGPLWRLVVAQWRSLVGRIRVRTFYAAASAAHLETLAAALDAGVLTPHIDTMVGLEHADQAMARVASRHARGKVVVTVG